ncbi:auxin-binding protein [Mesorhizobium sp. NBSH29]|nr:auxin-binding protein [Mesorhizobium sp. NBSH29]
MLAALVILVLAFAARDMFAPASLQAEPDLAREKASLAGLYRVTIAPEAEPVAVGMMHSWVVTVMDEGGKPVPDASLTLTGGMPAHGHGLPTSPQMTAALGEGRYRIEGVKFNMGGAWMLDLAIVAPPGEDSVSFNLQL